MNMLLCGRIAFSKYNAVYLGVPKWWIPITEGLPWRKNCELYVFQMEMHYLMVKTSRNNCWSSIEFSHPMHCISIFRDQLQILFLARKLHMPTFLLFLTDFLTLHNHILLWKRKGNLATQTLWIVLAKPWKTMNTFSSKVAYCVKIKT